MITVCPAAAVRRLSGACKMEDATHTHTHTRAHTLALTLGCLPGVSRRWRASFRRCYYYYYYCYYYYYYY